MDKYLIEGKKEIVITIDSKKNKLRKLCKFIRNTQSLYSLHLTWYGLGDECCKYLTNVLKYNKSLRILNLYFESLGFDGYKCLSDYMKYNQFLRILYVNSKWIVLNGVCYFYNSFYNSYNKIEKIYIGFGDEKHAFFHKHLWYKDSDNIIDQQKWFIQNFKRRNNKFKLLLFLKN